MKRSVLALFAGFLLLGLMPGSTMAYVGNLDLSNPVDLTHHTSATVDLAQTFTADKSGVLSRVDLYIGGAAATVAMNIKHLDVNTGMPTGSPIESTVATTTTTPGWVEFSFDNAPQSIFSGLKYAIIFNLVSDSNAAYGSTGTVGGGLALWNNPSWTALSDPTEFAFRTYVDTVAPTLAWNKTTIPAETSTALTLTETMTFVNGTQATVYEADLDGKPAWFTPTGIVCSPQITNCTLGYYESTGLVAPAVNGGETLTIVLTGTALPHNADVGTPGVATTFACLEYPVTDIVRPNGTDPGCPSVSASIGVGVPAPTAPPTSTAGAPASNGSGGEIWYLPVGLIAVCGGLVFLTGRRRRRIA